MAVTKIVLKLGWCNQEHQSQALLSRYMLLECRSLNMQHQDTVLLQLGTYASNAFPTRFARARTTVYVYGTPVYDCGVD